VPNVPETNPSIVAPFSGTQLKMTFTPLYSSCTIPWASVFPGMLVTYAPRSRPKTNPNASNTGGGSGVAVGIAVGIAVGAAVGTAVGIAVGTAIAVGGTGVVTGALASGTAVDASGEETSLPPPHAVNANNTTVTKAIALILFNKTMIQIRPPRSLCPIKF